MFENRRNRSRPQIPVMGWLERPMNRREGLISGLLGAGGGILSSLGGFSAAKSKNSAGFNAMNLYDQKTRSQLLQQGYQMFGSGFDDFIRAGLSGEELADPKKMRELNLMREPNADDYKHGAEDEDYIRDVSEYQAKQAAIQGSLDLQGGKGLFEQAQDISNLGNTMSEQALYGGGGDNGTRGGFLQRSANSVKGARRDIDVGRGNYEDLIAGLGQHFGDARNQVSQLYGRAEGEARNFARGREDQIRVDAGEALTNANQLTQARMAGLGANTMVGNQLSNNMQQNQREMGRALTDVGSQRTGMVMGAQLAGAGAQNALFQQQGSINAGLGGQQQQTEASQRGALRRLQMGRAGSLLGAENAYTSGVTGRMGIPLAMAGSFGTSQAANPWLGKSTSEFFPGASPTGALLGGLGQTMGQLGGSIGGQQAAFAGANGGSGSGFWKQYFGG